MALNVDTTGQGSGSNVDVLYWTHTATPGVAGYIIFAVSWQDLSLDGITITEMDHGENALSFICEYSTSAGYLSIWGGTPGSSFNQASVNWDGPGAYATAISISFTGVFQENPIGTAVHSSGTGTTMSRSITGVSTDNLFVDFLGMYRVGADETPSPNSSQTFRASISLHIVGTTYQRDSCSTRPGIDTTITMQWTTAFTWIWQQVAIELHATPTKATELALLGVGTKPAAT